MTHKNEHIVTWNNIMKTYDGCSDFYFKTGEEILRISPPSDKALQYIKEFISDHRLNATTVKITKNEEAMLLRARVNMTLTILHRKEVDNG